MFHELPWLPPPSEAERETLRRPDKDGASQIIELAGIAARRWNSAELTSLGRRLTKARANLGENWRQLAVEAGLTPFSLLLFSSNTSTTLVPALTAAAIARGILLECRNVEYQEPEAWLEQFSNDVRDWQPDATLLSLDRGSLRLVVEPGDAAVSSKAVDWAINRVATITAQIGKLTKGATIFENIADMASDPQASIDAWLPGSPRSIVSDFNSRLMQLSAGHSFIPFDVAGIANLVGRGTWDAGRYWYTAKLPFSPICAPIYGHRLVNLLASLCGKSRRALVLDLDHTIWGGVVGDDGVEGLSLGDGSALGAAHASVQRMAASLRARGIILCVASKNSPEVAMEAFRSHPEMILRESHITQFAIGWNSKAASIREMASTLNLGLEAFVFLDDNPVERKQVRDELPGVGVPELPLDPAQWLPIFQSAGYFEQHIFSTEDTKRSEFYRANLERTAFQEKAGDENSFLKSLQMVISISAFDAPGRQRIVQLIGKSNQFNLTTRRYSTSEIAGLATDDSVETFQVRLTDIFGDNGMISVVICRKTAESWEIDTWLMSCRVLGRNVERALLQTIVRRAKHQGVKRLLGRHIPTAKNGLVRDHYSKLGFAQVEADTESETMWCLDVEEFTPIELPIEIIEVSTTI